MAFIEDTSLSFNLNAINETPETNLRHRRGLDTSETILDYSRFQYPNEESMDEINDCWVNKKVHAINSTIRGFLDHYKTRFKYLVIGLVLVLYSCYLGYAIYYSPKGSIPLMVGTAFVLCIFIIKAINKRSKALQERLLKKWKKSRGPKCFHYSSLCLMIGLVIGIITYVCYDARHRPTNLISMAGIATILLLGFIISNARLQVKWRIVVASLLVQFMLGFVIVRWEKGLAAFEWMANQVSAFLFFTDHGSRFVFGELFTKHEFIMQAMPVVIYFGAWIGVLHYWGILQKVIMAVGLIIKTVVGVGPIESFVSAASVILDPNASAMTVSPFLQDMTISELHCIMTSGFSTVAGSLYGVYLSAGISASSLMAASVMSAPAALGMSKLMCPETEESKITGSNIFFPKLECRSALEAFVHGAKEGFFILVQVAVNLVAAVALLSFIDSTLFWFGARVGLTNLSFSKIVSYLLYPIAFIMGVDGTDCLEVARLLGTKLFLTEIVGYQELGVLINNRKSGNMPSISERSETIATFALCGFSSFPDLAILVSSMSVLTPTRKSDIAGIALRAMITGNLSCYLSACVAGLLYTV